MENFQLGDRIGSGAFGSVYKVIRKEDSKIYAMKRVKITQLGEKEKDNALNEIRILASLNHPNIIGYKEAFYDNNSQTLNIVMEYADDGDIESKISNNKLNKLSFQENTIWNILIQILQGLKYLHHNNIIHRDLKSANIFLMKNGLIKIGDLNVSKFSKIGSANTHTGTPYYSSPEIWTEQSYNYKTDIWSVGCIIYEMCNLLPPFRGTSLINLFNNIQKGVYKPVNKIYSKDLCKVISKMLIVDPEKRPSCDQLLSLNVIMCKMNDINKINENDNDYKVDLIQTIKFPKKVNDINKILPHKKMYNDRNEMMMNDEFETKKSGFLNEANKGINKENNNNYNKENNNNNNKQNNLINNPAKNNLNIKRPSSSFQGKNKEQKRILIGHSYSHKNPHTNNRYQNNIYHSYNSNIDNQNNNNLQNNIHHNNSNQHNNNNPNNYIQINNIQQQQNNKVRPSSGRRIPNNLVNNNRPNNNLINNNNAYHSNKLKHNDNKIQLDNKNQVKIRAASARPSHRILSNNNNKFNNNNNYINNNNNLNNNNNIKVKIISSKGSNNNNNKIIIEKINYYNGGKKKQVSKPSVGYKPKIGNRK